ncbi:IS110 family transposase [Candidatus Saganbacteria bacterium]|nr:IS110 family transposase [Candidatus Saganbacteria bacterium]
MVQFLGSIITIVIIDDRGEKIKEGVVKTDEDEIKGFFAPYKENVSAVVETCLNWVFVHRTLRGYIREIKVAQTYKLRIIAEAKVKTDSIDANTLAQMLRIGYIPEIYVPDDKTLKLRELIRARIYLVRLKTRLKNKIHSVLDKNGFRNPPGTDLFGKAGRQFLRTMTIGNPEEGIIARYLELIEKLEENIEAFEIIVGNNVDETPEIKLLRSIPGIGRISSHLLLAEIGPIGRFRNKERLCSFAGLCPRIYASGEVERRGHISKAGNAYMRWILTECAQVASRHSPGLRRIFCRIQRRHGGKVAVIAVARRMLEIVFAVLSRKEEFSETKAFPKLSRYASKLSTSRERSYIV